MKKPAAPKYYMETQTPAQAPAATETPIPEPVEALDPERTGREIYERLSHAFPVTRQTTPAMAQAHARIENILNDFARQQVVRDDADGGVEVAVAMLAERAARTAITVPLRIIAMAAMTPAKMMNPLQMER